MIACDYLGSLFADLDRGRIGVAVYGEGDFAGMNFALSGQDLCPTYLRSGRGLTVQLEQ